MRDGGKKRNKPTLLCLNCKRKKVKCDRGLPCIACKRSKLSSSCNYQPIPHGSGRRSRLDTESESGRLSQMFQDLASLREKIALLEASLHSAQSSSPEISTWPSANGNFCSLLQNPLLYIPRVDPLDCINFYEGYTPIHVREPVRRVSFGPLCWYSLLRRDTLVDIIRHNLETSMPQSAFTKKGPAMNPILVRGDSSQTDREFQKLVVINDGLNDLVPYKNLKPRQYGETPINNSILKFGETLVDNNSIDRELELADNIKAILPNSMVVWTYLDIFFKTLFPVMPYLDEESFREELQTILGPISYNDVPLGSFTIEKRMDLAVIAVLLIILRMTYLTAFSNRDCENQFVVEAPDSRLTPQQLSARFLLENPINDLMIQVAQLCISQFAITKKTNLTVFQSVLFLRIYEIYAPQHGDGLDGGSAQCDNSQLIQMAYSMGLNREPSLFPEVFKNERENNVTRKIWFSLLKGDLFQSYTYGSPPVIDKRHFDVQPTKHTKRSPFNDAEKAATAVDVWYHANYGLFKSLLDVILNMHANTPINQITDLINKIDDTVRAEFRALGRMKEMDKPRLILTSYEQLRCLNEAMIYLCMKCAFLAIYYYLYLHYEAKGDVLMSYFYVKKLLSTIVDDFMPLVFHALYGYTSMYAFIVNPLILLALHRSNQVVFAMLIRVAFMVQRRKAEGPKELYYASFESLIFRIFSGFTSMFKKFSTRYFFAWRIYKVYSHLAKVVSERDPLIDIDASHNAFVYMSDAQLDDLKGYLDRLDLEVQFFITYKDSVTEDPYDSYLTARRQQPVTRNGPTADPINLAEVDNMWFTMMAKKNENEGATNGQPDVSQPTPYNLFELTDLLLADEYDIINFFNNEAF